MYPLITNDRKLTAAQVLEAHSSASPSATRRPASGARKADPALPE
jgi:hypothetical protein